MDQSPRTCRSPGLFIATVRQGFRPGCLSDNPAMTFWPISFVTRSLRISIITLSKAILQAMLDQSMRDAVGRSIGLVTAHHVASGFSGSRQHRIRQPAVFIMQDTDFDVALLAVINRRERVHRHQDRWPPISLSRGDEI